MPDPFALRPARVHEAAGLGRRAFALFQAVRHPGPLVWILPAHVSEMPMPPGLPPGLAGRLHLLRPKGETDLLWATEESLRSAPVGLVIAEPQRPLSLTAGRRLQLAAEAGRTTGLMLIREGAGSNAAETRWHCAPLASTDAILHRWALGKNKYGATGSWVVNWDGASAACDLVAATDGRHEPAPPPRAGAPGADPSGRGCGSSALPDP